MLEILGLSNAAGAVYQAMLNHPGHDAGALAEQCDLTRAQVYACFEELGGLMLVRASAEHPGQLRAVSPEVGLADVLARQEAEIAARQAQLAASRAAVVRMVADRAEQHAQHGERLLGLDAIQARLERMGHQSRSQILGVHPGPAMRPQDLEAGRQANAQVIERGVCVKSLYQDATRNDPPTTDYAHWLLGMGSEVRTAPLIPQRMVIVDRSEALVPIDPSDTRKGALFVTEPGLIEALVNLFDQAWATAVPLGAARAGDPETGLTGTERELLRLLGTGLTDDTAGQRLGISPRTVSRLMSSIMERLGASSRFEAGIKAAQKGWL